MSQHIELDEEDDVVFAITSGYYPQIASRIEYKDDKKAGHGSTGGRYATVQGFTDDSVKKLSRPTNPSYNEGGTVAKLKEVLRERNLKVSGKKADLTTRLLEDEQDEDWRYKKLRKPEAGGPTHYWKWMGGSDKFKLYGNQIWYMHGFRGKDQSAPLREYVDSFGENKAYGAHKIAPAFTNIFSATQGILAADAVKMADKVFGKAMKEVADEDDFQEAVRAAQSQEEMGWVSEGFAENKEGSYAWVPMKRQKGATVAEGVDVEKLLDQINKSSYANVRDMAKVTIKNGKKYIDRIMDVTEMPIDVPGQHGISTVPQQLKDAISDVKKNDGMATDDQLLELKKQVTNMFVKAINTEYNPTIRDLKNSLKQGGEEPTTFSAVLKAIQKRNKHQKKIPVSEIESSMKRRVKTDSGALGSAARHDTTEKAYKDTALAYIVHMLGTWGAKTGNKFLQAHRVLDYNDGQSIYAFVKMRQFPMKSTRALKSGRIVGNAMEFDPAMPASKGGTMLHTGYSATLALEVHREVITQEEARILSIKQKRGWMIQRATNNNTTSVDGIRTTLIAGSKPQKVVQIYIPAKKELNQMLQGIMDGMVDDLSNDKEVKGALDRMQPELKKGRYSYNAASKRRYTKMRPGGNMNELMFWALPYIGIMTSEHRKGEY